MKPYYMFILHFLVLVKLINSPDTVLAYLIM